MALTLRSRINERGYDAVRRLFLLKIAKNFPKFASDR
jgi:hypothetical protein